jgi:hypothetical protein
MLDYTIPVRVFVSSTCYDLIDLRFELENFFNKAGLVPAMSETSPDRNSIETCLANVRSCDAFLIALSSRYGPSLKSAGYDDISATHLEYREAVKVNKRISMFVRDRLDADYSTYKKNPGIADLKLPWCNDPRLFALLEEHRTLSENRGRNNWVSIFRDSVELKRRLAIEFKDAFASVQATRLFESGRVPFLEITLHNWSKAGRGIHFDLRLRNLSDVVAVSPRLHLGNNTDDLPLQSLTGQQCISVPVDWGQAPGMNLDLRVRLTFSILEGQQFSDEGVLTIDYFPNRLPVAVPTMTYTLKQRRYLGASSLMVPAAGIA